MSYGLNVEMHKQVCFVQYGNILSFQLLQVYIFMRYVVSMLELIF